MVKTVFLTALASVLVIGCYVEAAEIPEEFRDIVDAIREGCLEEHSISVDLIENTKNGEFPDNQDLKCYMKCVLQTFTVLTNDGKPNFEAALAQAPDMLKPRMQKYLDHCGRLTDDDPCELAFKLYKCGYEMDPEEYIAI